VFDTHCHLDLPAFDADRAAVLARAWAAGVTDVLVPAIGPSGWERLLALPGATPGPRAWPRLHLALGIHPQLLPDLDRRDDDRHLADLDAAISRGGAVAVGECGLDGRSVLAGASLQRQAAVLEGQLALARKHRLPVSLHALRALPALLPVLERDGLPFGGVLHSYSGSAEQVPAFEALGLHVSFAGSITWPGARKPVLAARVVAPERLLIETDAPDQTPRPHRGRCEPSQLTEVAAALARAIGLGLAEVDALTSANARRLFLPAALAGGVAR
jgi:TatD DNase family protein